MCRKAKVTPILNLIMGFGFKSFVFFLSKTELRGSEGFGLMEPAMTIHDYSP